MIFILGLITGLLIAIIVFIITLFSKPKVERAMNQVSSRIKEKGTILEPENEELSNWVNSLPNETKT